jgi:hypothetical protein
VQGCVDGNGTAARFNYPSAIATDSAGNVFVTDTTNNGLFGIVRKITPSGEVATFVAGDAFLNLYGIATDVAGNVYVADTNGHVIQKISPSAVVSTIVGTGSAGFEPGTLPGSITYPLGVASWGNTLFITMDHGVAVADLP